MQNTAIVSWYPCAVSPLVDHFLDHGLFCVLFPSFFLTQEQSDGGLLGPEHGFGKVDVQEISPCDEHSNQQ